MYFLDFDRTLFDTNAFIEYVRTHSSTEKMFMEDTETSLAYTLGLMAESGALSFTAGELSRFVYPDVPEFLRMLGNEAAIVTHGNPVFQQIKIASALAGIPRVSALYAGDDLKGPFLAPRYASYGSVQVFADDKPTEIESVAEHCPSIRLFEMRRDGASGDGRWPVIRSLSELP